jgi:hypothetical protein
MSYEKTNWQKGDVITAEKLNNIENELEALDDRVFIVNIDAEDNGNTITAATADKTRQEMSAAVEAGKLIIIRLTRNYSTPRPSEIYEMTPPNIFTAPPETGGYAFTAEKILQIDGTSKRIYTAKLLISVDNNTDTITVSFPTYSFT